MATLPWSGPVDMATLVWLVHGMDGTWYGWHVNRGMVGMLTVVWLVRLVQSGISSELSTYHRTARHHL